MNKKSDVSRQKRRHHLGAGKEAARVVHSLTGIAHRLACRMASFCATPLHRLVFPVPGGPKRSTTLQGGGHKEKSTASSLCCRRGRVKATATLCWQQTRLCREEAGPVPGDELGVDAHVGEVQRRGCVSHEPVLDPVLGEVQTVPEPLQINVRKAKSVEWRDLLLLPLVFLLLSNRSIVDLVHADVVVNLPEKEVLLVDRLAAFICRGTQQRKNDKGKMKRGARARLCC